MRQAKGIMTPHDDYFVPATIIPRADPAKIIDAGQRSLPTAPENFSTPLSSLISLRKKITLFLVAR
jgi:hypothetical protein